MKSNASDYLKYWRVIRYYVKQQYGLTQADLDVILFHYSEDYFSKDKFKEFDKLISWNMNRFAWLLRDDWIVVFRKGVRGKHKHLYELSYKGKRLVYSIYSKLNGEEIPESVTRNTLFHKNVGYTDKRYRKMIMEMNAITKQQRRLSPE